MFSAIQLLMMLHSTVLLFMFALPMSIVLEVHTRRQGKRLINWLQSSHQTLI